MVKFLLHLNDPHLVENPWLDPGQLYALGHLIDASSKEVKRHCLQNHELDFVDGDFGDFLNSWEGDFSLVLRKGENEFGEGGDFDFVFKDSKILLESTLKGLIFHFWKL